MNDLFYFQQDFVNTLLPQVVFMIVWSSALLGLMVRSIKNFD